MLMKMRKTIIFFLLIIIASVLNAQLKVNTSGYIEIGTNPSTDNQFNLKGSSYFDGAVGIGTPPNTSYKFILSGNSYLSGTSNFLGTSNFTGASNFSGGNFYYTGPTSNYGPQFNVIGSNSYPGMYISPASTFNGSVLLCVGGSVSAAVYYTNSDLKLKKNITALDGNEMLSKIMNIDGKKYEFKQNDELELIFKDQNKGIESEYSYNPTNLPKGERYGFIAQEIEKEFPELVMTDSKTNLKAVDYEGMIPILLQSIKEQQKTINQLQEKINNMVIISKQNISSPYVIGTDSVSSIKNILNQNVPNPFTQSTFISYFISENVSNAMIGIYNMNGTQIRSYKIFQKGSGSISINANELKAGMYIYSLIIDGSLIDTKRMVLTD